MSAIDRAFIKAYSDEAGETVEVSSVQSKPATTEPAPAALKSTRTGAAAPRRVASRTKRTVSAAAIRGPEQNESATAPEQPSGEPVVASPAPTLAPVGGGKARMVVGRQALKQLAEAASVPPPHAAFAPGRPAAASQAEPHSAPAIATAAHIGNHEPQAQRPTSQDSRGSLRQPVSTSDAMPQQFRVDPAGLAVAEPTIAALEVDRLAWPPVCEALVARAAADFEIIAARLTEQSSACGAAIAVLSIDKGHGGTTVAMCLARILAQKGTRVCLVDGDYRQPGLAESLGLETQRGLESVLSADATLGDVLVESLEDQLTVLPLSRPLAADALERSKLRQTVSFGELRDRFDIVLIDAGCLGAAPALRPGMLGPGIIDSVLLVGRETADAVLWQSAREVLAERNVPCLGAIANRCAV